MEEKKIWAIKDGYLVHRDGSIYKLNWKRTGMMRKIKQSKDKDGYFYFACNRKLIKSHRFVAECFIPNPQNLPEINHKNEDKTDNRVENLEWCTHKYNNNYGSHNKRVGESISKVLKNHPKKSKPVIQYTLDGEFVKEWCSIREIERVLGYSHGNISSCCLGKQKTAYKSIWRYADSSQLETFSQIPR